MAGVPRGAPDACVYGTQGDFLGTEESLHSLASQRQEGTGSADGRAADQLLSPRLARLVREGDSDGRYGGELHRAAYAIAHDCILRSISFEEYRELLTNVRSFELARQIRDSQWADDIDHRIERTWAKALATRGAVGEEVAEVVGMLDRLPWPRGRAGTSARQVLAALVLISLRSRKLVVGASERELSELARLGRPAVRRALKALEAIGAISRRSPSMGEHAATFALEGYVASAVTCSTRSNLPISCVRARKSGSVTAQPQPAVAVLHDVWSHKGLSAVARRVWERILESPVRVGILAEELRISRSYLSRHRPNLGILQKLENAGMACRTEDGLWCGLPRNLDEVAAELGAAGVQQDLKRRHAAERARAEAYLRAIEGARVHRRLRYLTKGGHRVPEDELGTGPR